MKNLTKKEIVLIIILINILGYYILFSIIGNIMNEKNIKKMGGYNELVAQKELLEIKKKYMQENIGNTEQEMDKVNKSLFSETNSENIHYYIKKLANTNNLDIINIEINKGDEYDVATEKKRNIFYIDIEIKGHYKDKLKFIEEIESIDKFILITGLDIKYSDVETISKMSIDIYMIKKDKQDAEFMQENP